MDIKIPGMFTITTWARIFGSLSCSLHDLPHGKLFSFFAWCSAMVCVRRGEAGGRLVPKKFIVFCRILSINFRKLQVTSGERGAHPLYPLPRSTPELSLHIFPLICLVRDCAIIIRGRELKDERGAPVNP